MTKSFLGKQERAFQLGLDAQLQTSFELNQSCPSFPKTTKKLQSTLKQFSRFKGNEINSFCYSPSNEVNKSSNGSRPLSSLSFNASWSSFPDNTFYAGDKSNFEFKSSNKAVLTVDAKTQEVLTANKQACVLFEHTSDSIIHLKFTDLFKKKYRNSEQKKALIQDVCEVEGNITILSGKVMEIITKHGNEIPVSVWMRKYENDGKSLCLIMLQSVSRVTGSFSFNNEGIILSCNDDFARIHGYPLCGSLEGVSLIKLMPTYDIPIFGDRLDQTARKQYTTSTTVDGIKIPVSIYIRSQESTKSGNIFNAVVWYFSHVSGPLTMDNNGVIQIVNSSFSLALLGYTSAQLQNKNILELLPGVSDAGNVKFNMSNAAEDYSNPSSDQNHDTSLGGSFDSRSSAANISLSNSSNLHPSNLETSALDQINSLLLGKVTPKTKNQSKASGDCECNFAQRDIGDSWVEISLNPDDSEEERSCDGDALGRVNHVLNGGVDMTEGNASNETSPDSAVHWSSYTGDNPAIPSNRSHLSDYQSASSNDHDRQVPIVESTKENRDLSGSEKLHYFRRNPSKLNSISLVDDVNITSTPLTSDKRKGKAILRFKEGHFEGHAVHKDGSLIPVTYELRHIDPCDKFCMWISLRSEANHSNCSSNQTLYSSFNSTLPSLNTSMAAGVGDFSLGSVIKQAAQAHNDSEESIFTPQEGTDEWLAVQGKFNEHYDIKKTIGCGAFGFVRMARHKKTNKKFVVKFIRKEKVLEECWVKDYETDSMIPLEIALLAKFNHPNIVRVMDFYENDDFFAMLMPTHGVSGIDLFEFIDREPMLNELLASYIFRQIALAVYFLDQEGVVHRDLKDENVIIDEAFTCKLIDFGSAAFFKKGKKFSTFCGTVEYCSPEVLLGEKYEGPGLEIWALGVTLYTLVYGENPFRDVDETVEGKLCPPHFLSSELMSLIRKMLQPVPEHRCTIQYVVENEWVNLPVDISTYCWDEIVPPTTKKQSFVDASSTSKNNVDKSDENLISDSYVSSRETLAEHIRKWNEGFRCGPELEWNDSETKRLNPSYLPLTRRLENIDLNHSV